jgi:lipopolysaccharide export system permease protein
MIFKRSLLQELVQTAIATFVVLFGIVIAQRVTYYIGVAASGSLASNAINTLLSFSMIRFIPMLLSLTLFLAVLMTLSRLYRDSEMVIWFNSGLGLSKWVRPIMTFALPIILVISLLSLFVTPWAVAKSEDFKAQLQSQDELATITPGIFKESKKADRVYFIESFDQLGEVVKNIFVQTVQHQKLGIIVASSGHREKHTNNDQFLVMEKGRRYEGKPESAEFTSTTFEKYAIRMETPEVETPPMRTEGLPSAKLWSERTAQNNAELQSRLAMPISALILVLMAIPLSFVDPRSGRSGNLMIAIMIFIIYNNLLSIMQAWLSQQKVHFLVGLWPVHLCFLAIALYMFYRRAKQLPMLPRFSSR